MMPRAHIIAILAAREIRAAMRGRWFLIAAAAFAMLAIAVAQLGMAGAARWGVSALDRTTAALLNLVLLFVPLLALPLATASVAGETEDGTLAYLVAQPVDRREVLLGKLLGLCGAMTLSLGLGFGAAALWIGASGAIGSHAFLALAGGAWLVAMTMLALGTLLGLWAKGRARSLAAAIGAWITLVFLCDFGVLALAASQVVGPGALFGITLLNPLQAVKTLIALQISTRLEVLGPAGSHAVHVFGRGNLTLLLGASVMAWMVLSTLGALHRFRREDLT
jgi:Cu-processing system permease protein